MAVPSWLGSRALDQGFAGKLGNGGAVVVGLEEAVVLLARDARERLEPVGVVGGALGDGPLLHGMGHGVRHVQIKRLTAFDGGGEFFVHVLGEPLLHDVFGENHRAEAFGKKTIVPKRSVRSAMCILSHIRRGRGAGSWGPPAGRAACRTRPRGGESASSSKRSWGRGNDRRGARTPCRHGCSPA